MDAIVTAGGIPQPGEPLYEFTQGKSKSLLEIAGRPMIQWVLDALGGAASIGQVVICGLTAESQLTCAKPLVFLPNQGEMIENIRAGVAKALETNPTAEHVLVVSSDIPAITAEMVDWVTRTSAETDHDFYYTVITRQTMEKRYPGSRRTYLRLKDIEACGGDMNVIRASKAADEEALWKRIIQTRKSPLKQAALLGYDTLLLLLLGHLTLEDAVQRASRRLGIRGRAMVCPYAEIGMDVDKPHQLAIMQTDLQR